MTAPPESDTATGAERPTRTESPGAAEPTAGPEPSAGAEPRFIADAMLEGLARWLRLLGFDTAFEPGIPDARLIRRAVEENRVILTQDRSLSQERKAALHLVARERPLDQLREVVEAFGLAVRARPLSRCSRCNAPLVAAARAEAVGRVPSRIAEGRDRFLRCPGCGRVYWEGTHTARIRRELARALEAHGGRA